MHNRFMNITFDENKSLDAHASNFLSIIDELAAFD